MNKINTQNLKGVTDYYGKEQLIRNKIINTLKQTFENYLQNEWQRTRYQ